MNSKCVGNERTFGRDRLGPGHRSTNLAEQKREQAAHQLGRFGGTSLTLPLQLTKERKQPRAPRFLDRNNWQRAESDAAKWAS